MKRLLVLAAGILQIPIIKRAKEMGHYVIAADGNPNAVGLPFADKAIVANITSEEEMLTVAREEKIDGVIHPCSEVAMHVMGRINEELSLHGICRKVAKQATNKELMRKAFDKYGAPSPQHYCTEDVIEGWRILCENLSNNAILKPSRNSGSRGVSRITSTTSFDNFKALFDRAKQESRDSSVMIEQFIDGPEFSVEIIVWGGEIHPIAITDKTTTGSPYFVELGHSQPSSYPNHITDNILTAAVMGVKALKLDNCAAHAEIKWQKNKAYIMEIGARLGGDFISTELTHLSTGIDMVAAAINVSLGITPDLTPVHEKQGACIRYFSPPPGILVSIKDDITRNNPHIYNMELYVHLGDRIPEIRSSLDRSGHVIVTAENIETAISVADKIIDQTIFKTI